MQQKQRVLVIPWELIYVEWSVTTCISNNIKLWVSNGIKKICKENSNILTSYSTSKSKKKF